MKYNEYLDRFDLEHQSASQITTHDQTELSSYYVYDGKTTPTKMEVNTFQDSAIDQDLDHITSTPSTKKHANNIFHSFIDSFRRVELPELNPELPETERAYILASRAPFKRKLKKRHLQMIAIGGSIGAGLFVGSGTALRTGGPASVLTAWLLCGTFLYFTVQSLAELSTTYPVSGSFVQYTSRFISPSFGFAMAINYSLSWCITLPLELVAASITIQYWNDDINPACWVSIFFVIVIIINIFGVRGYGEAEFVMSTIKIIAIVGFIILGIVLNCGGGPKGGYIGGKYWHHPGAWANGFKGFCSVLTTAAFSFSGTELVGLTSAEAEKPQTLPNAAKQVFWRIALFYIVSLTLVGLLVPYTDSRLLSTSSVDSAASPFVLAIKNGGIKGLPSVMNAVVMISVVSVGNSAVFASSRSIYSLGEQGFGPKWFSYIDRQGRPLAGVLITLAFGSLCYLAATPKQSEVFTWLLASSGLSAIVTWGCICISHLRFRYVLKIRERDTDELAFTAQTGIWGSIIGAVICLLILIAQFWVALFPVGSSANAETFFQTWLFIPVLLILWIGYMIWKRDFRLYIKSRDVDIDTGRGVFDLDLLKEEVATEKEYIASQPFYYRVYRFWC